MQEKELRALIERMIAEVAGQAPTPQVKGSDYHPMEPQGVIRPAAGNIDPAAAIPDITQTDLRRQYLVESPRNGRAFLEPGSRRPPPRIGVGRRAHGTRPPPCSVSGPITRRLRTPASPWWTRHL